MKINSSLKLLLGILSIGIWLVMKKFLPEFELKDFVEGFVLGIATVFIISYIFLRFKKD